MCVCVCVCVVIVLNIFAPWHACAARVTNLTYGASAVIYSAGNKGRTICGYFSEITAFKSYVVKY